MHPFVPKAHWDHVYTDKQESEVSWFQERPTISLDLIAACGVGKDASIIDVGGGASRLVDALLEEGYRSVAVLDISEKALTAAQHRLGPRASRAEWIVADVTAWRPTHLYDLWHDRATFHFLTSPQDQETYIRLLREAVRTAGYAIIGTFAPDGPQRCSGLPVMRYDANALAALLGPSFALLEARPDDHWTPSGHLQRFQFSRFRRTG